MPDLQQIKRSIVQLSKESRRSEDPYGKVFAANLNIVNRSIDKISKIPVNERTPGQKVALEALGYWANNPAAYARTADIPARYGMGRLDPSNGIDYKCNRFIAEAAAVSGSPFPLSGTNPFNRTPVSAENLYLQESIPYMSNVSAKDAKIGDIISFSGHVGIYLGNGVYVSARESTVFYGRQVPDGVQITKVPWDEQPKFRRLDGRQASLNENSNPEAQSQITVADGQVNQQYSNNQNGNFVVADQTLATGQQTNLVAPENARSNNPHSETRAQLEAINNLIASNFSITPEDSEYKKVLPSVLQALKKENSDIKVEEISKLAGVSLQTERVL